MDVYAPLLTLALLVISLAAGSALVALAAARESRLPLAHRCQRLGRAGALAGLAMLAAALASHLLVGHTPGTDRAMAAASFAGEHPMPVALAALAALILWRLRWPRR